MKKNGQDLWSASLLDTFADAARELRYESNRAASISIARATLLIIGLVVALLLQYWLS